MVQIGYISPNKELSLLANEVFEELGANVIVDEGAIETGYEKAKIMLEKGVKVLISRGGTAQYIRANLDVEVIDIKITMQDFAEAIKKANVYGNKIAIIGFRNLLAGIDSLNPLLNCHVTEGRFFCEVAIRTCRAYN